MIKKFKKLISLFSTAALLLSNLTVGAMFQSQITPEERKEFKNIIKKVKIEDVYASLFFKYIFNSIDYAHKIYSSPNMETIKLAFEDYKTELQFLERFYASFQCSIKNDENFCNATGINTPQKIERFNAIFKKIESELIESYNKAILKFY